MTGRTSFSLHGTSHPVGCLFERLFRNCGDPTQLGLRDKVPRLRFRPTVCAPPKEIFFSQLPRRAPRSRFAENSPCDAKQAPYPAIDQTVVLSPTEEQLWPWHGKNMYPVSNHLYFRFRPKTALWPVGFSSSTGKMYIYLISSRAR